MDSPICLGCGKVPAEIREYVDHAKLCGYSSPDHFVLDEEGTYDVDDNTFYCTMCYIKAGMPINIGRYKAR